MNRHSQLQCTTSGSVTFSRKNPFVPFFRSSIRGSCAEGKSKISISAQENVTTSQEHLETKKIITKQISTNDGHLYSHVGVKNYLKVRLKDLSDPSSLRIGMVLFPMFYLIGFSGTTAVMIEGPHNCQPVS